MSELTRYHSYAFDTDGDEEESVPPAAILTKRP